MKNSLFILLLIVASACQPRIEMDMEQWGDHAFIDNVEIVKLEIDDEAKLAEYYQNETPMEITGVRNIVISEGTSAIDSLDFTATVKLKAGEDLKYAGLKIYHRGTMVVPLENSPKAGIVSDLSNRMFKYRLESADGSKHDWTIKIE